MINKRPEKINLTTSLVIPCYSAHAKYLNNLLNDIETNQTILPDEVVISLSGSKNVSQDILNSLNEKRKFSVNVILSEEDKSEAENRNIICSNATKDIIIGQDADDFSHPQRIEVIKYFFEHFDIIHLAHSIMWSGMGDFVNIDKIHNCKYLSFSNSGEFTNHQLWIGGGPVSFLRSVFGKVKYDESINEGCDTRFNCDFYALEETKNRTIVVLADLYRYNWDLSVYPR